MKSRLLKSITSNLGIHLLILFAIFIALFLANFPFNTWYTGWDNLHPEFDFALNFKRLFSIWQTNEGLGTFGGHGFAATLPHTLLLFISSLVVPIQFLRSLFTFFTLFAGSLGMFFLVRYFFADKKESTKNTVALLSALFYLLNLSTIQQFYIQLEAFIVHFAALPWLFLSVLHFLDRHTKKSLLLFFLISFVTTVQGFIPPLFLVYLLTLSVLLVCYVLSQNPHHGTHRGRVGRAVLVFILTICINAYWLLPVGVYTVTRSSIYLNAYNNLSSTEDFILKNKKYGDIQSTAILKGFIFEAIDTNNGAVFIIFDTWEKQLQKPWVLTIDYTFFAIIVLGAITLLRDRRRHYSSLAFGISLIFIFTLLTTNTPPFSFVSELLQQIPVFKQAFRVAFTKFSISLSFFYAISFAFGLYTLLNLPKTIFSQKLHQLPQQVFGQQLLKFIKALQQLPHYLFSDEVLGAFKHFFRHTQSLLILAVIAGLVYTTLPAFTGSLLYERTKVQIPKVYSELFSFFKQQDPNSRIANLPQGWNWGWSVYRWGYSGSGFLWYGIEQPIMDRAFDVWGQYNEDYYWEMSYAIYSENFDLVDKIAQKYQINWLVFDKNIVPYPNVKEFLFSQRLERYLNSSPHYTLVKKFDPLEDNVQQIYIYKVNLAQSAKDFVLTLNRSEVLNIGPIYKFTNIDTAYAEYGNYYTNPITAYDVYFPFRSLFSNRGVQDNAFTLSQTDKNITIQNPLPPYWQALTPQLAPIEPLFATSSARIDAATSTLHVTFPKKTETDNGTIVSYNSKNDTFFLNHEPNDCKQEVVASPLRNQYVFRDTMLRFVSENAENCYSIILSTLPQRYSYLATVDNRHVTGKRLQFAVVNPDSNKADIESNLTTKNTFTKNYFVIPQMRSDGLGYNISFNNISIGNVETVNDLKQVTLYPMPFDFLRTIAFINPTRSESSGQIYIYFQSFDPFWKAYEMPQQMADGKWPMVNLFPFIFGKEIKNHVIVNNWANGWLLEEGQSSKNIQLFYLPQLALYAGVAITILGILIVLFYPKRKSSN